MSEEDVGTAISVLADISKFPQIADRLQQGFLAFLFLGRLMPHAGDELHHFGWNACSSCLCPYAPHPHMDRPVRAWHEEDGALRTPRPAADAVRVGQHGHRTAGDIDSFQFAASEEGDAATVGRPERKGGALGIGKWCHGALNRSYPERASALGPRREGEPLPVG